MGCIIIILLVALVLGGPVFLATVKVLAVTWIVIASVSALASVAIAVAIRRHLKNDGCL